MLSTAEMEGDLDAEVLFYLIVCVFEFGFLPPYFGLSQ